MSLTITLWASSTHNTVAWCSRIEYNKYSTNDNYSETHPLGILFVIQIYWINNMITFFLQIERINNVHTGREIATYHIILNTQQPSYHMAPLNSE